MRSNYRSILFIGLHSIVRVVLSFYRKCSLHFNFYKLIKNPVLCYFLLFVSSMALIVVHKKELADMWTIFYWWLLIIALSIFYSINRMRQMLDNPAINKQSAYKRIDYVYLAILLVVSVITRFLFLGQYPYIGCCDELRDQGWQAFKLMIEKPPYGGPYGDLFAFGWFRSYGNLIILPAYIGIKFLGQTFLAYRIPCALFSVTTILFTYFIVRIWRGNFVAFIAGLLLIASPHYLHFSRTQILMVFDAFYVCMAGLAVYLVFSRREAYFVAGMIAGFTFHLYAGTRGIALALGLFLVAHLIFKFYKILFHFKNERIQIMSVAIDWLLLCIGIIIAIGPTLNFITTFESISHTDTGNNLFWTNAKFTELVFWDKITYFWDLYVEAFSRYTFTSFPNAWQGMLGLALLRFPLPIFFFIGFCFLLVNYKTRKDKLSQFFILLLLIFPFTNAAIVMQTYAVQRWMGIMPILSAISAYGIFLFFRNFTTKNYIFLSFVSAIIYLNINIWQYFYGRMSDAAYPGPSEYVYQAMMEDIKKDNRTERFYVVVTKYPYEYKSPHFIMKTEYMTSPKKVQMVEPYQISKVDNTLFDGNTKLYSAIELFNLPVANRHVVRIKCYYNNFLPSWNCPHNFTQNSYEYYVYY